MGKTYYLNEDYQVVTDSHSLLLQHKVRTDKNPDGTWRPEGYYPNLRFLIAALYEKEIRDNINYLERLQQLKDELIESVKEITDLPKFRY